MNRTILLNDAESAIKNAEFGKALELLTPLAEQGDSDAQFLLGYLYFTNADVSYLESTAWLQKSAEQSNPMACYYLSIDVNDPNCLSDKDRKKYLEKSALLGYPNAQRDLGCAYATGEKGFKKNESKALWWYKKAAEQGYPDAQFNLGTMLLNGEGCAKNIHEGIEWIKKSDENGIVEAKHLLNEI
jgi:uncharacterized protein